MKVEFIIPTYDRITSLRSMLSSLVAQYSKDWKATIIIDTEEPEHQPLIWNNNIEELINNFYSYNSIHYKYAGKRYNDFGHTPREIGKQEATGDYILMTGDDNYYTPNFVEELVKASETKPGVIYWDMIHSHYNYSYFKCYPNFNQIDMGAFATRRDIAQSITLNTTYAADGEFIEEIKKKFPDEKMIKIDKVLFVHN